MILRLQTTFDTGVDCLSGLCSSMSHNTLHDYIHLNKIWRLQLLYVWDIYSNEKCLILEL